MENVVKVFFGKKRETQTRYLFLHDYGIKMVFEDIDLPDTYEVHFGNSPDDVNAKTQIGTKEGGVAILDEFLTSGSMLYSWVFLHAGASDGETRYVIKTPLRKKPRPTNASPTPVQKDVITEAIAALSVAVEKAEGYAASAAQSAEGIEDKVDAALQEAKDSGEFDGPPGPQGKQGDSGPQGEQGEQGIPGVVFTPSVSSSGVLSWTNDGGKQNPDPVDIVSLVLAQIPTAEGRNF